MEEGLDGAGGSRCHLCVQVFGVEEQQLGGGGLCLVNIASCMWSVHAPS